ncbi:SpoIIE family protein phosphatase [bacterium]|nr:SpoIIE family protein phosphatase [bacterium]
MFRGVKRGEWKFPAEIDYLGQMRDAITQFGRKFGVSERVINAFKLAIDEAGTNIIRHAYRDWPGEITVRMIIRQKTVTVSLIDQGHAFDPRNVQDPDLKRYVEIGKKGGLGIFIIRRVIDTIDFRKTEEGNELRLTKSRSRAPRVNLAMPDLAFTMKTRFSLIASVVFTVIVLSVSLWNYNRLSGRVVGEYFQRGNALARTLADQALIHLAKSNFADLFQLSKTFHDDNTPWIAEVLVLDSLNAIQGAAVLGTDAAFAVFREPSGARLSAPNIRAYKISDLYNVIQGELVYQWPKKTKGKWVYDVTMPAWNRVYETPSPLGTVHILLDKSYIDSKINASRRRILGSTLLALIIGYAGIFGLVYITMSPFKRLAKWVRALGHGEVQDEMEFDGSDEIGEIAMAFNDITEKFRKSQENLAEQERLQKEMQVAQEIQHTLLPSKFPDIEGYEIASYYEAAKEVGGDYFDFVEVDKDTLGIVVADVSGKGVPGSLIMTMIRTALRTEARGNKNAADVLSRVNDFVLNDMKRGMFVTVFYIILDSKRRTINYASAGHNPMILYRGKTQKSYYLNPKGFPIGINLPDRTLFRRSIESDNIQLREDDILLIYTDGITEAMNTHRDRYGEERFLSIIRKFGAFKVDPLVEKIRQEIAMFTGGYAQSDDITLVAIRERLKAEDVLFNVRSRLMQHILQEGMSVKEACKKAGVSTSTYYKYRKRYDAFGVDGLKEQILRSEIEEKHISIEDKAKIYNIIKENPDWGPKKISEELMTEKYGKTRIDESRIYDELVRSRLNTKELRAAFVERGARGKRLKPPGTPFLTLDGKVIISDGIKRKIDIPAFASKDAAAGPAPDEGAAISSGVEGALEKPAAIEMKEKSEADFTQAAGPEKNLVEEIAPERQEQKSPEMMEWDEPEQGIPAEADHEKDISDFFFEDAFETGESLPRGKEHSKGMPDEEAEVTRPTGEDTAAGEDEFMNMLTGDSLDDVSPDESWKGSEEWMDIEDILSVDDSGSSYVSDEEKVLDQWSGSAAESLLSEDIGDAGPPDSLKPGRAGENGGFMDLVKELGFDHRNGMNSGDEKTEAMKIEVRQLNMKRFLDSGQWFYKEGFYAKAIEEFKKALELWPESVEGHLYLGDAHFRLGQLEKALKAYERVRELDPDNIQVLENLGVIFANQGDYKKAVWQWGEVLKRNPERTDIIERIKRMQRVIRQRTL